MRSSLRSLLLALGCVVAQASMVFAGQFLMLEGIPGESQARDFAGTIEVSSFSIGVESQSGEFSGAAARARGKVQPQQFVVTKPTDTTTPALLARCAGGQAIGTAKLSVTRTTERSEVVAYEIELTDVMVTSVTTSGGGDDRPMDNVTFSYAKMTVRATKANDKGGQEKPVEATVDFETGKASSEAGKSARPAPAAKPR